MNWTLLSIGMGVLTLAGSWLVVRSVEREEERRASAVLAPPAVAGDDEPPVGLTPPAAGTVRLDSPVPPEPLLLLTPLDPAWTSEAPPSGETWPSSGEPIDFRPFSRAFRPLPDLDVPKAEP
jgi:hypothetical protein